jgi:soluble lytic murein transglycosylase-like protein
LLFALLLNIIPAAYGKVYIYVGPTGEKLISDRPVQREGYSLQHQQADMKYAGILAAGKKIPQHNRAALFDNYIASAAKKHDIEAALVKAVIRVESNFNPVAISPKGATGLMQLMPMTAKQYNVADMFNPIENIDAGTKHLRYLVDYFNADMKKVLAAYNAGEHNVERYHGIPPFKETQNYVVKVMRYWQYYRRYAFAR